MYVISSAAGCFAASAGAVLGTSWDAGRAADGAVDEGGIGCAADDGAAGCAGDDAADDAGAGCAVVAGCCCALVPPAGAALLAEAGWFLLQLIKSEAVSNMNMAFTATLERIRNSRKELLDSRSGFAQPGLSHQGTTCGG